MLFIYSKLKSSKSLRKVNRFLNFLIVDDNVFKTHLLFNKLFGKGKAVAQKAITIFISKKIFLEAIIATLIAIQTCASVNLYIQVPVGNLYQYLSQRYNTNNWNPSSYISFVYHAFHKS
jgi:hypothetical protein